MFKKHIIFQILYIIFSAFGPGLTQLWATAALGGGYTVKLHTYNMA